MKNKLKSSLLLFAILNFGLSNNLFGQPTTTYPTLQTFSVFDAELVGDTDDIYLNGPLYYIKGDNTDKVEVEYTPPSAGTYTVRFFLRSDDNGSGRANNLYLNDAYHSSVAYSSTSWGTVDKSVSFTSGANVLSLRKSWGYTYFGYVSILDGETELKRFNVGEEGLTGTGTTIELRNTSPHNRWHIDYRQDSENPIKISYTYTAATSGKYRFSFDINLNYDGGAQDRAQNLYVNDSYVQSLVFNPTNIGEEFSSAEWFTFHFDSINLIAGENTIEIRQSWGYQYFSEFRISQEQQNVTINGNAGWRMLSSPKSDFTVSDISDDTAIQGVAGGTNDGFTSNFYTFSSNGTWSTPTNVSTVIADGYGFIVKFFDNTNAGSTALPVTLDLTGEDATEDVIVELNKSVISTAGEGSAYYTLLGNPYASNIDLSELTANGDAALGATVQVWDNAASDYEVVTRESGILEPWQGFWAWVNSTSTATEVTIPISAKTASTSSVSVFKSASQSQTGVFSISQNSFVSKPFRVLFQDEATLGLDIFDAAKLTPLSDSYIALAGRQLTNTDLRAIESLPIELESTLEMAIVPLIVGETGEFNLNWEGFSQFPAHYSIELQDSETNELFNLRNKGSIKFNISNLEKKNSNFEGSTILSGGSERFKLVISPITTSVEQLENQPIQVELAQNFPNPFNPSTQIRFTLPSQSTVRLSIFDMLGREVAVLVNGLKASGKHEVNFDASAISSGIYMYRLEAGANLITKKMTLLK